MSIESLVREELDRIAYPATEVTVAGLSLYVTELERWNKAVNLTALQGKNLLRRLIIEPIWIGRELQISGELMDVGSGNGSPAIPLALTRNLRRIVLVESRARRAAFLRHMVQQLGLINAAIHKSRLEHLHEEVGAPDYVTLQAVAPEPNVLEALRRLVSPTTQILWITSGRTKPVVTAERRTVPHSDTEIWIFSLDQS